MSILAGGSPRSGFSFDPEIIAVCLFRFAARFVHDYALNPLKQEKTETAEEGMRAICRKLGAAEMRSP